MWHFQIQIYSLIILQAILIKHGFYNITQLNYKARILQYSLQTLIQMHTVIRIRKSFFKRHGNQFIRLKRTFPAINIASRFKISKYVIYLMSHVVLYMPLILIS